MGQEAFVVALERWPEHGVPDNPGAWLVTTAKHRAIDALRRGKRPVEPEWFLPAGKSNAVSSPRSISKPDDPGRFLFLL